ncbi:hypothetical protein F4818DRAFT_412368 [Hypoxylon cercidicola]|nr:hypothetical protein F4818DRAFT_412368 [Hypoxylon cercidicola]
MLLKSFITSCKQWAWSATSILPRWNLVQSSNIPAPLTTTKQIEDYRAGYPQLSALLSSYDGFLVCRSFRRLRARLLLQKQDRLSVLEQKLDQVDQEEVSPLFLGKLRVDRNQARISLLSEIDKQLADYDSFLKRTQDVLASNPAMPRDVESIKNWLDSTSHVSSAETAYLDHVQKELVCLGPSEDSATRQLETWVEESFIRYYPQFREAVAHDVSRNEDVYIYSGPLIKYIARVVLLLVISLLLLTPIVVCNAVLSLSGRIWVVAFSTMAYLLVVSALAKSRTIELIVAGATFATILIVFVAGNNESPS